MLVGAYAMGNSWQEIRCPGPHASSSCTYKAQKAIAISIFFQYEPKDNKQAWFECRTDTVSHCARSWHEKQSGSAGSCYFFLNAGDSYECSGEGVVNIIGAHGLPLDSGVSFFDKTKWAEGIHGCNSGAQASSCAHVNTDKHDQWIALSFVSRPNTEQAGRRSSVSCRYTDTANALGTSTTVWRKMALALETIHVRTRQSRTI